RLWTMRQFAGFGSPQDTNSRFKYLNAHGVTGLSTAFDMPELMGYDADHSMSPGAVGTEGVAISTLKAVEIILEGIKLDEIAKFRAARRIRAKTMRDRFGAKDPRSLLLRTHAQTAGVSLTAQQPYNTVVRTAMQALAAVLGGTQSLHTNSLDETYALPTEDAVRLALRTQQIIAYESGVDRVVDPLAGSYYVEYLTDEMEKRALQILDKIAQVGGIVEAV